MLGAIAGLLAKRWLSTGPPTPDLAIEEAKIIRQTFEHQGVERDQLERSLRTRPKTSKRGDRMSVFSLPAHNRSPEQINGSRSRRTAQGAGVLGGRSALQGWASSPTGAVI